VLAHGREFLAYQAGIAIVVDSIWVAIYAAYLVGARTAPQRRVAERMGT
jgi:hypothetical protein